MTPAASKRCPAAYSCETTADRNQLGRHLNFDPSSFRRDRVVDTRDSSLLRRINDLTAQFPAAALHREALRLLGSDFVDVREWDAPRKRGEWTALIRFGGVLEAALGITREVMVVYSRDRDLQLRDYERLPSFRERQPRQPTQDLYLLFSEDPSASRKLDEWTQRETFTAIVLPRVGPSAPVTAQALVNDLTRRLASRNLYEETLPVTGRDFFGRRDLLLDLAENLRTGKVCGVFGLRKTGKTSLVQELGQRFVKANPEERVFILRDLEDLPADAERHPASLQRDLTTRLLRAFRDRGLRTHELSTLTDSSTLGDFRRALQAALEHRSSHDVQVVIALDEIESLVGQDAATSTDRPHVPELLGILRSLVQENHNFNVLISGLTSSVLQSGLLYGRENPLFAWAKTFYLPPLDQPAANQLIEDIGRRMALRWSQRALTRAFGLSEGHVFLHRTLCARIAESLPRDLSEREVDEDQVQYIRRAWRRGISEQVQAMLASLDRYYPDAADVLRMLGDGLVSADEADMDYPSQTELLLQLGLVREEGNDYPLTAFSRMALSK